MGDRTLKGSPKMKKFLIALIFVVIVISFLDGKSKNVASASSRINSFDLTQTYRQNNMLKACAKNKDDCANELRERIVNIQSDIGSGTGFILEGDRDYLTILTASHVIRRGNGQKSSIASGMIVINDDLGIFEQPLASCAFFTNAYADVGLIKILNTTNIIFEKMEIFESARAKEKVLVIDHKYPDKKRAWTYTIDSFSNQKNLVFLHDSAQRGMSGSPIIKLDGRLIGILIKSNSQKTQGTFNFVDIIHFGIDYLNLQQNYFAPYICS